MKAKNFCNIPDIQQKLIDYSSSVFHYYFNRDMDSFVKLLDPDFVWIGSYHFQYTKGIDPFLEITKEEAQEIAAEVFDEEYQILSSGRQLWALHGKFSASAWNFLKTGSPELARQSHVHPESPALLSYTDQSDSDSYRKEPLQRSPGRTQMAGRLPIIKLPKKLPIQSKEIFDQRKHVCTLIEYLFS